jgi:hypothetical protein
MKPLEMIWRPLVERRLLPVAIVLVAALVAVPFLLKKDPAPAPAPAPVPVADSAKDGATADPVVSLASTDSGTAAQRRRVLGASKNPFEPGPAPKVVPTPVPGATTPQTTAGTGTGTTGDGGSTTASGGTGGAATPPASAPPASAPPAAKPKYELYSLTVRFGASEGDVLPKMNLPRLKALPSAEDPVLVYLGLTKDKKSAIFMVDSNVEPQGDGSCDPSPANCETIKLHVGDTEFFDVKGENDETVAQYQLDLVKVARSTTASASAAKAARAKVSKSGRRLLRSRKAAQGPLRWSYDAKSGSVTKLDRKAYKAAVAKTARIALAFSGGF